MSFPRFAGKLALAGIMVLSLIVFSPAASRAEQTSPNAVTETYRTRTIQLADVVQSVLQHSPVVGVAAKDRDIANADVRSAAGGFDPALKARGTSLVFGPYVSDRVETTAELPTAVWGSRLFAGYRVSRGDFAVYDGKLATADFGEAKVGAQIPILRDGPIDRRRAGLQRAELGVDAAQASLEQQRLEAVRSASHRYWDWVAAGRRVAVAREIFSMAMARDVGLARRVERGDIPMLERAENERVIHQRTAQIATAERALFTAGIELSLFLRDEQGLPKQAEASQLPEGFPEDELVAQPAAGSLREAEKSALERRPEIRRIDVLTKQASVDRRYAENQRMLGVDLVVAGAKDFGTAQDPKLTKPELEVSVLVDVPLFTRVQDGRVDAANASLARLALQSQVARERTVADVRDATAALSLTRDRIKAVRDEIQASKQLIRMELERFELGEGTLLLVNLREQALAEAEQREIDALADYFKAQANQRAALAIIPGIRGDRGRGRGP